MPLLLLLSAAPQAFADEGMFLIHAIDAALEKKMQERGLALPARAIYDADAPGAGLSDAVVSLDFMGTGSVISREGLLITNHHCAYSDLHALSTSQKNYLEDGFRACLPEEEIPIKGKSVQFLKQVLDVTDEVGQMQREAQEKGVKLGSRKLSWTLEKKYEKQTGLSAQLAPMWGGSKYYLCLYQEYKDVRLVAAPPLCMAAFGGDVDNWQWPQQKCDFALYRIYTAPDGTPAAYAAENRPLQCAHPLKISARGLAENDFTMVVGYPGRTDRYSSSFKVNLQQERLLPLTNAIREEKMKRMKAAMNADPQVRLKYADKFFSLSNVQEMQQMQEACCRRFGVVARKQERERRLQAWIDADAQRTASWGGLLHEMDSLYRAAADSRYRVALYQETMMRATAVSIFATRLSSTRGRCEPEEWDKLDMGLERRLFDLALETWFEKMDTSGLGPFHKRLLRRYGRDYAAMSAAMWAQSPLTDGRLAAPVKNAEDSLMRVKLIREVLPKDTLFRFFNDVRISDYQRTEDTRALSEANRAYKMALYEMYRDLGVPQYPDANSTMRLSYGRVGRLAPSAGDIRKPWYTTPKQLLKKHNPADYDFALREDVYAALKKAPCKGWNGWGRGGMKVDFITDNDITGGNSGSPVLNARGELVGLAFDGNAESLASDVDYTPEYNKCICVDIRYVLWTLDVYMALDRILGELDIVR